MLTLTSERQTPLHRLPAGLKLAALAALTLALFALPGPWAALGPLGPAGVALVLGLLPALLRQLRALLPVCAIILAWHALTGTAAEGAFVTFRLVAAFAAANLVTLTTRLSDMQGVFLWLARPFSALVAPERLALAMALVIRFLPVLSLRAGQLGAAWSARSARRIGWPLVFAITLAALDDAEHVADALRARGGVG